VDCEPLIGLPPVQAPEAVHAVALPETQVNVELPPRFTVPGSASNFTCALNPDPTVTISDCVTLPPIPVQVSV
jgi:hypothetical protein